MQICTTSLQQSNGRWKAEKSFCKDKVNYAVSKREDRVTDLTTLTRMTGCTGMYWAATGQEMG